MAACRAAICIIYTIGSSFCKGLNNDRDNTGEQILRRGTRSRFEEGQFLRLLYQKLFKARL